MGQGKYNFDYVAPDPNRKTIKPLGGDGIAVGTIRTRPKEKQFCECDEPEPRDSGVRVYQYVDGMGVVELKTCKFCGLPIGL